MASLIGSVDVALVLHHLVEPTAFARAIAATSVAGLFSRAWFFGLVYSLDGDCVEAFQGAFGALSLHVFFASLCGCVATMVYTERVIAWACAYLIFGCACLTLTEMYYSGREEDLFFRGRIEAEQQVTASEAEVKLESGNAGLKVPAAKRSAGTTLKKAFHAVLNVEMFDCVQVVLFVQFATLPLFACYLGCLVACFFTVWSSVMCSKLVAHLQWKARSMYSIKLCFYVAVAGGFFCDAIKKTSL